MRIMLWPRMEVLRCKKCLNIVAAWTIEEGEVGTDRALDDFNHLIDTVNGMTCRSCGRVIGEARTYEEIMDEVKPPLKKAPAWWNK